MTDQLTHDQIDDMKADLAYHERQAALIRERLARVPVPEAAAEKDAATNRVAARDACPGCGERNANNLVWLNDEDGQVRCSTCDFIYIPPSA